MAVMRRSTWFLVMAALLMLAGTLLPALAGGDVRNRSRKDGPIVGTPPTARKAALPSSVVPGPSPRVPGPDRPAVTPPVAPTTPTVMAPDGPSTPAGPTGTLPVPVPPLGLGFDPVARAQQYGVAMSDQLERGAIQAVYNGLGQVAGEMVDMKVTNVSATPVTLKFIPGMVMDAPPDSGIQPLLIEEEFDLVLQPKETVQRRLVCYCLDRKLSPPAKGKAVAFVFSRRSDRFASSIKVLYSGLKLDASGQYNPMLAPLQHRRIVIQRAIWSIVAQKPATSDQGRTALKKDIKDDASRSGKSLATRQLEKLTDAIWKDVTQTLEQARGL